MRRRRPRTVSSKQRSRDLSASSTIQSQGDEGTQARSRQKQLDRMERLDAPVSEQQVRLRLPEAPGRDRDLGASGRDGRVGRRA